jgi:hypothetical protein
VKGFKFTVVLSIQIKNQNSKIKNQQSTPEGFARTGEAIVNQINAFVAKNSPLPTSHFWP